MKEDCDVDDLVDVIEGSRVYIPCIYVINKIDQVIHPSLPFVHISALSCSLSCLGHYRGPALCCLISQEPRCIWRRGAGMPEGCERLTPCRLC